MSKKVTLVVRPQQKDLTPFVTHGLTQVSAKEHSRWMEEGPLMVMLDGWIRDPEAIRVTRFVTLLHRHPEMMDDVVLAAKTRQLLQALIQANQDTLQELIFETIWGENEERLMDRLCVLTPFLWGLDQHQLSAIWLNMTDAMSALDSDQEDNVSTESAPSACSSKLSSFSHHSDAAHGRFRCRDVVVQSIVTIANHKQWLIEDPLIVDHAVLFLERALRMANGALVQALTTYLQRWNITIQPHNIWHLMKTHITQSSPYPQEQRNRLMDHIIHRSHGSLSTQEPLMGGESGAPKDAHHTEPMRLITHEESMDAHHAQRMAKELPWDTVWQTQGRKSPAKKGPSWSAQTRKEGKAKTGKEVSAKEHPAVPHATMHVSRIKPNARSRNMRSEKHGMGRLQGTPYKSAERAREEETSAPKEEGYWPLEGTQGRARELKRYDKQLIKVQARMMRHLPSHLPSWGPRTPPRQSQASEESVRATLWSIP